MKIENNRQLHLHVCFGEYTSSGGAKGLWVGAGRSSGDEHDSPEIDISIGLWILMNRE